MARLREMCRREGVEAEAVEALPPEQCEHAR